MKILLRASLPIVLGVSSLLAQGQEPQAFDRLTFHKAPRPLPKDATTSSWTRFLGPTDNARSPETKLLHELPENGPDRLWEIAIGEGYASPAIQNERLILFHRLDGKETIECVHAETGRRWWVHDYAVDYEDRYGYSNGPRSNPVIEGDSVFTLGVTSQFTCLDLITGKVKWTRDLRSEYQVPDQFFGAGSTPLVKDGRVYVNVGGAKACVIAMDAATGKVLWETPDAWSASYASPIAGTFHGKETLLVFAGGESDPPTGGLLLLDRATGKMLDRFPWRSTKFESVNASTPVIAGENLVYISECYSEGGVMLQVSPAFKLTPQWSAKGAGCHWMTPVAHDGFLYLFSGRHQGTAELMCLKADTGEIQWRDSTTWEVTGPGGQPYKMGLQRASLLQVDDRFLALGELGSLVWMNLTPKAATFEAKSQLFFAPSTWALPCLSKGLLYICQHDRAVDSGDGPRVICYDLRAKP